MRIEIEEIIGIPAGDCRQFAVRLNIEQVLSGLSGTSAAGRRRKAPLHCLIFDSYYDSYLGVVVYVRVMDGCVRPGDKIMMMSTRKTFEVVDVGIMEPFGLAKRDCLAAGDVGYITASIKNVGDTRVSDTVTHADRPCEAPLPGFKKVNPMVYAGIYPSDGAGRRMRDAQLKLNDASLVFEPETSVALGFGFRCGFLGLLHMEIIEERLEREFGLDLITTAPSVIYEVELKNRGRIKIDNPTNYPSADEIEKAYEPIVRAGIITPTEYVGGLMELCQERRGVFIDMKYLDPTRVELSYRLPLNEIIFDFFDTLKSRSRGYASLDYELDGYTESRLVKLDFLIHGEQVDALTFIVHEDKAYPLARRIAEKLKENIPRQLFEIPIQAAIGGRIIARETVKALRKNVLSKCYGGDITRKKKLLEKQKEGKKKMRQLGSVQVDPEAFMAVFRLGEED